ncbi:MAG: methylenetetrahydrofolate reductase [Ilumatobacteraceae bacterium]
MRFSYEVFPPKTAKGHETLRRSMHELQAIDPTLISVTYGAGGGERERSFSSVELANDHAGCPVAAHLTCVGMSVDEVHAVIDHYLDLGITHIVALRGDPPSGIDAPYQPHPNGFQQTDQLVAAVIERAQLRGQSITVSVSAYPEKHPQSPTLSHDIDVLAAKVEAGATRAMTQMFFDNSTFLALRNRIAQRGLEVDLIPGIMPIHSFEKSVAFAQRCGASIPSELLSHFASAKGDAVAEREQSITWTQQQIEALHAEGIDEFHLYSLNSSQLLCELVSAIRGNQHV